MNHNQHTVSFGHLKFSQWMQSFTNSTLQLNCMKTCIYDLFYPPTTKANPVFWDQRRSLVKKKKCIQYVIIIPLGFGNGSGGLSGKTT